MLFAFLVNTIIHSTPFPDSNNKETASGSRIVNNTIDNIVGCRASRISFPYVHLSHKKRRLQ